MLNYEYLPTVDEKDVEVGRDFNLHTQQSSCQKAALDTIESEIGGMKDVHTLPSLPQEAAVPEHESEDVIMTDRAPVRSQDRGEPFDDTEEVQVISSRRVTRAARKRQEKAVETRKRARAVSVDGNLVKVEVRLPSYNRELEDTKAKLAASEKGLKELKAQLKGKKKNLATCRRKCKESRSINRNMKKEIRDLQSTLKASQEELSKCKDDLFSLQEVDPISDSAIVERFDRISQQIIHWIETEVVTYEKAHPEAEPDRVFSVGEQKYAAEFLRLYPDAGEHLARHLIHHALQAHVFGRKVYLFGLPEETTQLLLEAELRLAKSDPPRDSVAIASWRSETLKALLETTKCKDDCQQQAQNLNNNLFKRLSMALPELFSGPQAHDTFYDQVLLPAVELANAIKMSTTEYVFVLPQFFLDKFEPAIIDVLKTGKMVDSQTGKHLKPGSAVVTDKDGVIGHFIISLEPELCRVIRGQKTTLNQGTILVELYHPLAKRVKTSA